MSLSGLATAPKEFADRLTVRTALGERTFSNVYVEVAEGVLMVTREGRTLSWFADGQWTEASFI